MITSPRLINTKKRRRKPPISPEFCDISDASFTTSPNDDVNAGGATEIFKVFMMRPDRRGALILEVSHLDKEGGIIFSDRCDDEAQKSRQALVERVKKSLKTLKCLFDKEIGKLSISISIMRF